MREDMYKVVINRPRHARRFATKAKLRYLAGHDVPSRITGKQIFRYKKKAITKSFSDHVMPLKRYLFSQRGRKWDDVFSEVCARLDTGSTVKMHVHEHIDQFIERKVMRDDEGILWACSVRWGGKEKLVESGTELYVDPDDNIIKETVKLCQKLGFNSVRKCRKHAFEQRNWERVSKRYGFKPYRKDTPIIKLTAKDWRVKLKGFWYDVSLSNSPLCQYGHFIGDHELYNDIHDNLWRDNLRFEVTAKRQLSSKQLKAAGLNNDHGGAYV